LAQLSHVSIEFIYFNGTNERRNAACGKDS